jgi:hypothetical protein
MNDGHRKLEGPLRTECAEWIWEQMQEEGYYISGEIIDLVLDVERELDIHASPNAEIARQLEAEFARRGIESAPTAIDAPLIEIILSWEDEFLGFAGIPRAHS